MKEEVRESAGVAWVNTVARDLRYAVRVLRKNPAFALTVIVTLALCIGANTAIFSIVDGMLLRPLPYPDPDRLGMVSSLQRGPGYEEEETSVDGLTFEYVRDHVRSLQVAVHSESSGVNLAPSGASPRYVQQQRVSAGFFSVLGVQPMLGREITLEEDQPGGPAIAILSEPLWRTSFGSNRSILGQSILLRGEPYQVIGVMPAGFDTTVPSEIWTPIRPSTEGEGSGSNYGAVARVRPGFTWNQANAELATASAAEIRHLKIRPGVSITLHLISVQRGVADYLRTPVLLLWAAVGLVLLIGCVNVASLMLARSSARQHEIATRLVLGCGRSGILRQLLAESLLLASVGGCGGLALGYLALAGLKRAAMQVLMPAQPPVIDLRVLTMTATASVLTSLIFGLYPAFAATRTELRAALARSSRTASAHHSAWLRHGLVAGEVSLGMVLLVGAGLVLRTFASLAHLNPGYDGSNVLTANLSLQDARYVTPAGVNRLFDQSLTEIRKYPSVVAAGIGLTLPYERALNQGARIVDGPRAMAEAQIANVTYVTPGYFEALRVPLLQGRLFEERDRGDAQRVALANAAYLRRNLKDDVPLGRHVTLGGRPYEIVGVVGDVQEKGSFGNSGPIGPVPNVYVPAAQFDSFQMVHTWFSPSWVVRTVGPQVEIAQAMRTTMARVDPQLPFAEFRTMDEVRSRAFALHRLEIVLLGTLAGLALLLAAIGIYGLIAHSVVERAREIGIRLALGASIKQVIRAAAGPGILLSAVGILLGSGLAYSARNLFATLIYGVRPTDSVTFAAVAVLLLVVATGASLLPSLRIARIDPARTLREE